MGDVGFMILVKMKCKFADPVDAASYLSSNVFCRIDAEESEAESEYEEYGNDLDSKQVDQETAVIQSMPRMSWLLQIALENLGVTVCSYIVSNLFYQ